LFRNKLHRVIKSSAAVMAGNSYLADYARQSNSNVHVVPTVVDTERFRKLDRKPNDQFTVGWLGSPSTAPYLEGPAKVLESFSKTEGNRLVVVGSNGNFWLPEMPMELRDWSEATEVEDINSFDVGIMPLPDTDWARGKCAFKLIQYMACGIPVVASAVGMNSELIEHGVDGFLVKSDREWAEALEYLRQNPQRRLEMGERGRRKIEERFSLSGTAPRLERILRTVV
jgi:glycosyltransferase involved in cell wall biosynthesis